MSIFSDFKENYKFDNITEEKIKKIFPKELSDILCNYGSGDFLNGYFRFINPFEYQEVIKDTYFDAENSLPFMITAFGDVIVYKKDGYIGIIKYKEKESAIIGKKFHYLYVFWKMIALKK